MLDTYAVDSSVLVASLIPSDEYYDEGTIVIKRLLGSDDIIYASAMVPVEVCTAVARRTRDKISAREVQTQIAKWIQLGRLRILYLNAKRMRRAQEIGIEYYVRGMDAIIAQIAEEKKIPLVTFDQPFSERISPIVKTITQDNLTEEILPLEEEEKSDS
jgi:predicted nucleic acid-binding protein